MLYPKTKVFLFLLVFITMGPLHAQSIEKYAVDLFFGGHATTFDRIPSHQLDFMNHVHAYDEYLVDEAYLAISSHFWLQNQWELNFKLGVESDLIPVIFDLRATRELTSGLGFNLGLEHRPFFINNAESHYSSLAESYTINSHPSLAYNYFQFNLFLFGPYTGVNYTLDWKRLRVQAAINAGIFFNNKNQLKVVLKEKEGNYLWSEEYALRSSPGPWVNPELKLAFTLLDGATMQLGVRIGASYFISRQALPYDYTRREWTLNNSETTFRQMPSHLLKQAGVDFGLFILKK